DLNYYSSMRHDLKKLADNFHIKLFIIYISTPFNVCIKWNNTRKKPIPNKIIKKIHQKFDKFTKYNWDSPVAEYDLSQIKDLEVKAEELAISLISLVNLPPETLEEGKSREQTPNVDNQNLDRITRIYVGKLLQNLDFLPMKKKLSKTRKSFVKLHKNQFLNEIEIVRAFKEYLEQNLSINISEELF
ncbi:MAG: hypothetical protein ACXACB_07840, partial [Promethearchaeota archaeon]